MVQFSTTFLIRARDCVYKGLAERGGGGGRVGFGLATICNEGGGGGFRVCNDHLVNRSKRDVRYGQIF